MDSQRVAVIGAQGFIGAALVSSLLAAGVAVECFTREVPFVSSQGELADAVASATTVFWMASSVNPAIAEGRPDLVEADQVAFDELLGAAKALDRPPRTVLLSSGGTVYDASATPPHREDAPTRPVTAYGRAKLALEQSLLESPLPRGSKLVMRVSNAYGPGQPARSGQGVIGHWLHAAALGQPLVIIGSDDTVRDYIYVDDVVDALVRTHAAGPRLPEVLNVGSGRPTSLGELAAVVLAVVDDPAIRIVRRPARSFDVPRTWLDPSAAYRALGWRPTTSLRDGVAASWEHIRRQHRS